MESGGSGPSLMLHPLSGLPVQAPPPSPSDWREPLHFQYHLLLSFHARSHLTHFPLLSKDSAQFSSLLPHSSDPILSPFPQRHDPICLHPSSCTCRHPPPSALTLQPQPLASALGLRITPVPPRFRTRAGAGPAPFSPRPHHPLLQHREGPAPLWHSLLCPRCVPGDLTQFPHSSNPAPTLDLTTRPLPKDVPGRSPPKCQGHSRCQRSQLQSAARPCAGNYRRTCYGQRKAYSCLCLRLRFCY